MRGLLLNLTITIFSLFVGSQLTEAMLLVPYWQSLSAPEFYAYFKEFGPGIAGFYTVLTILAALSALAVCVYAKRIQSKGFVPALISVILSVVMIAMFYVYFKGANASFLQAKLNEAELKAELVTWSQWHWSRIGVECIALLFLIRGVAKME